MARERSYRHDIRCRHCGSNWMPKDGHTRQASVQVRGLQAEVHGGRSAAALPEQTKRQAVQMRIEGASISAAARVVGASAASVSGWVKKGGR